MGELRKLGTEVAKSTVEKYRVRPLKPSSPTWKALLENHVTEWVAMDLFVVSTLDFEVLYVLGLLSRYFEYYHHWRTHLSLSMNSAESRPVQLPARGAIIEYPGRFMSL